MDGPGDQGGPSRKARPAPLPPDEWPPEMSEVLGALRPPNPRHDFPARQGRPKGLNILGLLARHPELSRAYNTFNGHLLFATTLTPRWRELAVLRVAALRRCAYEWAQHAIIAADVGISEAELTMVRDGGDAVGWETVDAALLRAVDELITDARIADSTWGALAEVLDDRQLMDLVFTVGAYDALAMAMRSFDLPLDDDLSAAPRLGDP